jgi:hypothetical protein
MITKNKFILALVGLTLFGQQAKAENPLTLLKEYGVPCLASIGASALLVKEDGVMVGAALCAGLSSATFLTRKPVDDEKLSKVVESFSAEREKKLEASLDEKFKASADAQDKNYDALRRVIREVLAERLVKMEDDLRASFEKSIKEGDLLPSLEKKLSEKIKEEVVSEGRMRNKELVSEVVDEVIRQVVAKPIAVPDAQ